MKIFKKGSKWWIDYYVNGKRFRRSVGDTKAEADKVMTKIKYELMHKRYAIPLDQKISFESFAMIYVKKHVISNQKSANSTFSRLKHLVKFFGDMNVGSITLDDVDSYISWRLDQISQRNTPVSKTTVNRELEVLKNMLNTKAKDWGYISEPQIPGIKKFKESDKERILKLEEIDRLIDVLEEGHIKDFILIALNSGMRKIEILSLEYKHINFEEKYIYVEKSKSGRTRKIPLNETTKTVFEKRFRNRGVCNYIFENPKTKRHYVCIKKGFHKVLKKADIKDFTIHSLRHNFATYAMLNGADIYHLSKILGHANISTTLRYLSATSDGLQKVVDSFVIGEKKMKSIDLPFAKAS